MNLQHEASSRAFGEFLRKVEADFSSMVCAGKLKGKFSDEKWLYKGVKINFRLPLVDGVEPFALGQLVRMYAMSRIRKSIGGPSVRGDVYSFLIFANHVGCSFDQWASLRRTVLDGYQDIVRRKAVGKGFENAMQRVYTAYEFLKTIRISEAGGVKTFLKNPIKWKPQWGGYSKLVLDVTTPEFSEHREKKYNFEGARYLALSHAAVCNPPPGADVRDNDVVLSSALAFQQCTGQRITQTLRLPSNCLALTSDGEPFLRVDGAKGNDSGKLEIIPHFREVAIATHRRLYDSCEAARLRARKIEDEGFGWLIKACADHRAISPLDDETQVRADFAGEASSNLIYAHELKSLVGARINEKLVATSSRQCCVVLPTLLEARVCLWFDKRFAAWDLTDYSKFNEKPTTHYPEGYVVEVQRICEECGVNRSNMVQRHRLLSRGLKIIMEELRGSGALDPSCEVSEELKAKINRHWKILRNEVLANAGAKRRILIKIDKYVEQLTLRYVKNVEEAFSENISDSELESAFKRGGLLFKDSNGRRFSDRLMLIYGEDRIVPCEVNVKRIVAFLNSEKSKPSVFERYGIKNEVGEYPRVTSHQLRHVFETSLMKAGASEAMVALLQGKDPGGSAHYDGRTGVERADQLAKIYLEPLVPDTFLGRRVMAMRANMISNDEIETLVRSFFRIANFMPWGQCTRDINMLPCVRGFSCFRGYGTSAACKHYHIDPSDEESLKNVAESVAKHQHQLDILADMSGHTSEALIDSLNSSESMDLHISDMVEKIRSGKAVLDDMKRLKQGGGRHEKEGMAKERDRLD